MGAQLPARWSGGSKRLSSMPNGTMDRLDCAVAGQLQCRVRWRLGTVRVHPLQKSGYILYTWDALDGNRQNQTAAGIRPRLRERPVVDDGALPEVWCHPVATLMRLDALRLLGEKRRR